MTQPLVIGVSARALFDMDEANAVFERDGRAAYLQYQQERARVPLDPGAAFPLVSRLLDLNKGRKDKIIEVVILSGLHPSAGVRIMNTLDHYSLDIGKAAFTGGGDICPYLDAFSVDLFLSQSREDVQEAVNQGHAAALMYEPPKNFCGEEGAIRIAFDGDAVLFSPESELIYKREGLEGFLKHEKDNSDVPMKDGPLARFLRLLHGVQASFPEGQKPFRISLVTMRDRDARARAINTLSYWGVEVDEAYFLGGVRKEKIVAVLKPHIFFDDQEVHLKDSSRIAPAAQVPYHKRFKDTELARGNYKLS